MASLAWAEFALTADTEVAALDSERARDLRVRAGEGFLQSVTVTWRLAGQDRPPARQQLWLTFADDGNRARLLADSDLPPGTTTPGQALWWQEPVTLTRADGVLVLAAAGTDAAVWRARAGRSLDRVERLLPARLSRSRPTELVLQLPATRQGFERVLGVTPGSAAQLAAAAWPIGPSAATAPVQVIVNPAAVAGLDPLALDVLTVHETVHVVLASPASAAPAWLVEGYADHLAYRAHPAARPAAARVALDRVRADGPPTDLPTDAALAAGAGDLDLAYAQACLACRFAAETFGEARLGELYAAADRGTDVAAAIRSTLGLDEPAFLREWQSYLRDLAAAAPR